MKIINEVKVVFDSRSVNESFARIAVSGFLTQLDPTIDEITDIKTAVSEAVTNSIVHAYPNKVGKIYISVKIFSNNEIEIVIKDRGVGIDNVEKAMEPMWTSLDNGERSGLGFSVMETFMDKISVKSKPGSGTTVKLRKRMSIRYKHVQGN